jgi:hypothetical protein
MWSRNALQVIIFYFGKLSVVRLRQFHAVSQILSVSALQDIGPSSSRLYFINFTFVSGGAEEA